MKRNNFAIADFFSGIGGMRLAFEQAGFQTVYAIDNDPTCCHVYKENFCVYPLGDVIGLDLEEIPDFDVFVAGFPCQPFSLAGRKLGLKDERGKVVYEIFNVLKKKRPKAFLLENVKHFFKHDQGRTFALMKNVLKKEYNIYSKIINAKDFGLPQNRERLYIVGLRKDVFENTDFEFPRAKKLKLSVKDILENNVSADHYLSRRLLSTLQKHKKRHKKKGNGFGMIILNPHSCANTLLRGNMGRERNLVIDTTSFTKLNEEDIKNKNRKYVRYLTPREYARLQGFSDSFKIPIPKTAAYKLLGNSVPVPVVKRIAEKIMLLLRDNS